MWKRFLTLVAGALLASCSLPLPVWAADGDQCAATQWASTQKGTMKAVWCILLCDNSSAGVDCPAIDMRERMADVITFELFSEGAGCTVGTIEIRTLATAGSGRPHSLGTLNFDSSITNTKITINNASPANLTGGEPIGQFVDGDASVGPTCAGSEDVMMVGYEYTR